jgi:hypothetical protein
MKTSRVGRWSSARRRHRATGQCKRRKGKIEEAVNNRDNKKKNAGKIKEKKKELQ